MHPSASRTSRSTGGSSTEAGFRPAITHVQGSAVTDRADPQLTTAAVLASTVRIGHPDGQGAAPAAAVFPSIRAALLRENQVICADTQILARHRPITHGADRGLALDLGG